MKRTNELKKGRHTMAKQTKTEIEVANVEKQVEDEKAKIVIMSDAMGHANYYLLEANGRQSLMARRVAYCINLGQFRCTERRLGYQVWQR